MHRRRHGGLGNHRLAQRDEELSSLRATTEVNSECFAALQTVARMARTLERHEESAAFSEQAVALREAINRHLINPENGLYYLNIDINGMPRSDVTADLVFPVMFGVAAEETATRISQPPAQS